MRLPVLRHGVRKFRRAHAHGQALLCPGFWQRLATGISFPAARQQALEALGIPGTLLEQPNDILATEYCKAILAQGSSLLPFPVTRRGSYHAETPDAENPSATALRRCIALGTDWLGFVPPEAASCFENAPVYTLAAGERAILARLRTMTDREFEALPYGSEGLWRPDARQPGGGLPGGHPHPGKKPSATPAPG